MSPVDEYIAKMKSAYRVNSDEQLASKLGKAKQTIASWRLREAIPDKVVMHMVKKFGLNFASTDGGYEESRFNSDDCIRAAKMLIFASALRDTSLTADELLELGEASRGLGHLLEEEVLNLPFETGAFIDDRYRHFLESFDPQQSKYLTYLGLKAR